MEGSTVDWYCVISDWTRYQGLASLLFMSWTMLRQGNCANLRGSLSAKDSLDYQPLNAIGHDGREMASLLIEQILFND